MRTKHQVPSHCQWKPAVCRTLYVYGMYSGCQASHARNDKAKDYRRLEHISHLICSMRAIMPHIPFLQDLMCHYLVPVHWMGLCVLRLMSKHANISQLSPNDHGVLSWSLCSECVCADVLSLLISNLVLTATTNKFDLINFEPASVRHSGSLCQQFFLFFLVLKWILHWDWDWLKSVDSVIQFINIMDYNSPGKWYRAITH